MTCLNTDHYDAGSSCAECARDCEAELVRQRDLYMQALAELAMWRTKATQRVEVGEVPPLPHDRREGTARSAAGFEAIDGTDVLQLTGRSTPAREDLLVGRIFHATTGGGRSIRLRRQAVEALTSWLADWLDEGWPGVPRECGRRHNDEQGREWRCGLEPGHRTVHDGPATGWRSTDPHKPGRRTWLQD